jgi:hypothetical protein
MKYLGPALIGIALCFAIIALVPTGIFDVESVSTASAQLGVENEDGEAVPTSQDVTPAIDNRPVVQHVPLPEQVKNI